MARLKDLFIGCFDIDVWGLVRRPDSWFKNNLLITINFLIVGVQGYTVKVRDGR